MKKFITTTIIILAAIGAQAQKASKVNHGFWVAETSKQTNIQVIRFYNDNARLIHSTMMSKPVNIKRKANQQMLNDMCEELYRQKANMPATIALNIKE